jgi:hypothetical protein
MGSNTHKKYGTLKEKIFLTRGILKFTFEGRFLTFKKAYKK